MRRARKAYQVIRTDELAAPEPDVTGQAASDLIAARIASPEPVLVARLGASELGCIWNFLGVAGSGSTLRRSVAFVRGRGGPVWWEEERLEELVQLSGFFPRSLPLLERFCELFLADVRTIDVLGSWRPEERVLSSNLEHAVRVRLRDIEPYYHDRPWSAALQDKTVLVVHPFVESIRAQYARRSLLFDDPRVLPEFELKTLQAVQSIVGTATSFHTWFDAFASMRDAITATDFDVAIIGAGAYGMPLAAHVKRLGRKAVHLGGATQVLFGIKGKRWDTHAVLSALYNEYWVRPLASERPERYEQAEGGSYW